MQRAQALQIADWLAGQGYAVTIQYSGTSFQISGSLTPSMDNVAKLHALADQSTAMNLPVGFGVTITDPPLPTNVNT